MKPHLPLLLLQSLVLYSAPLALATDAISSYNEGNKTLTITGVGGDLDGNGLSNVLSMFGSIENYGNAATIIFDMTDPGTTNTWFSASETISKNVQIGETDAEHGLRLHNGASAAVLTLSGTVTGNGTISRTGGSNTTLAFAGDVSGFTGNIILGGTGTDSKLRFGDGTEGVTAVNNSTADAGISGTGTITFTTANDTLIYNYSTGKDVYITNTFAKSGSGSIKISVQGSDNLVFTKTNTIDNLQVTNANASLGFQSGTTTTIGTMTGTTASVNKQGTGLMRLTGTSSFNTLTFNVNEGELQVYNTGGTTLGTVNLAAAGSKLTYYNTANNSGNHTLTVNTLNVTADATLETTYHAGIVQIGALTGGADTTLTINGASASSQTQWVLVNGGSFSGTLNVQQSATGSHRKLVLVATDTEALSNATVDLNQKTSTGSSLLVFSVGGAAGNEVKIAGLNGIAASNVISGGTTANIGTSTLADMQDGDKRTLTLTGAGEYTYAGTIGSNLIINKTGAGSQTLGSIGNNVGINVQAGTLELTGTIGTNAAIGLTGGTLSGATLTSGMLTANSGTLTDFTLNGGTIDFGTAQQNGQSTISYTGTLALTGGDIAIDLSALAGEGSYTLLTGSGGSSDLSALTLNGLTITATGTADTYSFLTTIDLKRYSGEISWQDSGNLVIENLTLLSQTLTWGGGDTGTWQDGTTDGWDVPGSTGGTSSFANGDSVTFHDVTTSLTIEGSVDPAAIVVSGASNVTLTAGTDASIIGVGSLILNDTATLTIGTSNSFSGGTTINGGVLNANAANALGTGGINLVGGELVLGHAEALGSSTLAFNGGSLQYGTGITTDISAQIIAGTGAIKVDTNGNDITWSTNVLANHAIEKSGDGRLTLNAVTLGSGANVTIQGGTASELAVNISSAQTTWITEINKLNLSGDGTLVKTGAGTWTIAQSTTSSTLEAANNLSGNSGFGGNVIVESGTLQLGTGSSLSAISVSPDVLGSTGTIFVGDAATLGFNLSQSARVVFNKNITLQDGATLTKSDGFLTLGGTLAIGGSATINNLWGAGKAITIQQLANADLGGEATVRVLTLTGRGEGSASTTPTRYTIDGTTNSYIGEIVVGSGASVGSARLAVTGSLGDATSTNSYRVTAGGSSLLVSGANGAIANRGARITATDTTSSTGATLTNVTFNQQGISQTTEGTTATVSGATIAVTAPDAFTIETINLVNSLVDIQSSSSVTLDNVTIGAGTTVNRMEGAGNVTLNNSKLVMTTAQTTIGTLNDDTLSVTSTGLAGYTTISGSLTFDLTQEWIANLVNNAGGNFTTIELTFSDVNADVWNDFKANPSSTLAQTGELNDSMFGPPTVTFGDTAGTVIIAATTNIPEPATATLGLLGLSSLLLRRRRKA